MKVVTETHTNNSKWDPRSGCSYTSISENDSLVELTRDTLGLNKLFYDLDRDRGVVTVSDSLHRLVTMTRSYNRVRSVPSQSVVRIDKDDWTVRFDVRRSDEGAPPFESPESFRRRVDEILSRVFTDLDRRFPDHDFAVCLSGGLDSAVIATYAARFLKSRFAVTFAYDETGDDLAIAKRVANLLSVPHRSILVPRSVDEDRLRNVLIHGQDWRDFNVHCAWVNDHLAETIAESTGRPTVVLTGDLMNEFLADYEPVVYRSREYYELPNLPKSKLRRFLTMGLDAGDREIGIFAGRGLQVVQPFAAVESLYSMIPDAWVDRPNAKRTLNSSLVPDEIAALVPETKMRAQTGDRSGGTLGLFIDSGIDQAALLVRWNSIFEKICDDHEIDPIISAGRYRN